MRKLLLASMIGLTAAMPARAERFALSCTGSPAISAVTPGRDIPLRPGPSATYVFVIDEEARTIHSRALSGGAWEEYCEDGNIDCSREFSAESIVVRGSGTTTQGDPPHQYTRTVLFNLNRRSNRLDATLMLIREDGIGIRAQRALRCKVIDAPATAPAAAPAA